MNISRARRSVGRHARDRRSRSGDDATGAPADRPESAAAAERDPVAPGPTEAAVGPYDSEQSPPPATRLDLGSLRIPSVTGVQVRVQANQQGAVQRVMLAHGKSTLHLAAVAAPRSEPLWDEVREEIRQSLAEQQIAVEEISGEYGTELRATVPGKEGRTDVRFVGVDGPRWLVRADFHGPAARDPERSPQLVECLRGLVVDRGAEAKPAKEPLPLRLSEEMAAQVQQQAAAADRRPSSQPRARGTGPPAGGM